MKKLFYKLSILFISLFILFSSCKQDINKSAKTFTINVAFKVEGAKPQKYASKNLSRAAFPEISKIFYIIKYYDSKSSKTLIGTFTATSEDESVDLDFPAMENYYIFVEGYDCENQAECNSSNLIVNGETTIDWTKESIVIEMKPDTEGSGSIELPVSVDAATGIKKCIAIINGTQYTFNPSTENFAIPDINPGAYDVDFNFYSDDECKNLVYYFREKVNVFSNLITNIWDVNTTAPYYDSVSGIKITQACISKFNSVDKTVFYVGLNSKDNPDGTFFSPYPTIQQAVDIIEEINDGTSKYSIFLLNDITAKEDDVFTSESLVYVNPDKSLKLDISSYKNSGAVISAEQKGRVFYFGANTEVNLKYVDITKGLIGETGTSGGGIWNSGDLTLESVNIYGNTAKFTKDNSEYNGIGGGVYTINNLTVSNSCIYKNTSGNGGGGIYGIAISNKPQISISGSTIGGDTSEYTNTALHGGGLCFLRNGANPADYYCIVEIGSTVIKNNTNPKLKGGTGGGIWYAGSKLVLKDDTVISNNESYNGGGILLNKGHLILENATISNNIADLGGGGIYAYINSDIFCTNSTDDVKFESNKAENGSGGAIYIGDNEADTSSFLSFMDSKMLFKDNYAKFYGGAIYQYNRNMLSINSTNITFDGNATSSEIVEIEEKSVIPGGGTIACGATNPEIVFTLSGISITNSSSYYGGAIYIDKSLTADSANNYSFSLENLKITGCSANIGGAIYVDNYTRLSLNTCTVGTDNTEYTYNVFPDERALTTYSNTASIGGGIYCNENVFVTISDSSFANNLSSQQAGALYLKSGKAVINNSELYGNRADGRGGIAYIENAEVILDKTNAHHNISNLSPGFEIKEGALSFTNGTIINDNLIVNSGGGFGGAVHIPAGGSANLYLNDCTISNNTNNIGDNLSCDINMQAGRGAINIGGTVNLKGTIYCVSTILVNDEITGEFAPTIYVMAQSDGYEDKLYWADGKQLLANTSESGVDYVEKCYKKIKLGKKGYYLHSDGKIYTTSEGSTSGEVVSPEVREVKFAADKTAVSTSAATTVTITATEEIDGVVTDITEDITDWNIKVYTGATQVSEISVTDNKISFPSDLASGTYRIVVLGKYKEIVHSANIFVNVMDPSEMASALIPECDLEASFETSDYSTSAEFSSALQSQLASMSGNKVALSFELSENETTSLNFSEMIKGLFSGSGTYSSKELYLDFSKSNITVLGVNDFTYADITGLVTVVLPATLKEIKKGSFTRSGLKSIIIPDSVEIIGENAFDHCDRLISVVLPHNASFTELPAQLFYQCSSLESITIPESVTKIGKNALRDCSSLNDIIFESPGTWYVTENSNYTGGQVVDFSDPEVTAGIRENDSTYTDKYFYKQ